METAKRKSDHVGLFDPQIVKHIKKPIGVIRSCTAYILRNTLVFITYDINCISSVFTAPIGDVGIPHRRAE